MSDLNTPNPEKQSPLKTENAPENAPETLALRRPNFLNPVLLVFLVLIPVALGMFYTATGKEEAPEPTPAPVVFDQKAADERAAQAERNKELRGIKTPRPIGGMNQ